MTGVLKEETGIHRDPGREETLMKMEAETWALCPQAEECQLLATPAEAEKEAWNRHFSEPGEGSDLQTLDLRGWRTEP